MNIVREYVERNHLGWKRSIFLYNDKFNELEEFIGINFPNEFRDFINDLEKVDGEPADENTGVFIVCSSKEPTGNSYIIGGPVPELNYIRSYKEYTRSLRDDMGLSDKLYPIFDELGYYGRSLICINSDGLVYSYSYEFDNEGYGNLLANSLDEFIDRLKLIKYHNLIHK